MREIRVSSRYKKCLKKVKNNPRCDIDLLNDVIQQLAENGTIPETFKPHPLLGQWKPAWECHIQPDFLLIYDIQDDYLKLIACGSHSELF